MKDWFERNCRPTGQNKMICSFGNEVEVIDPLDSDLADKPATEDNVEKFIERSKSKEFE